MSVAALFDAATLSGYPARHLVNDEPSARGSETTQRRPELAERLPVAHVGCVHLPTLSGMALAERR